MEVFEVAFQRKRSDIQRSIDKTLFSEVGMNVKYLTYFQSAINAYYNNNLGLSFEFINEAIKICPFYHWRLYAFRGNILEENNLYEDAISDYIRAIDSHNYDIYVYALYHQIGWCYLNLKDDVKAIEFYTYAIDLKSKHPNTEYNEDLEGMDNGVVVGKEYKQMYINRGNSLKNIGKLNDAQQDCLKAIQQDSNYSNPYLLLYQIYDLANQREKAIQFLKKSASMGNPNANRILNQIL